ncbi:Alpha/Beta hydrolase protein [Blastocladiella britannica]|nr:Alpha/Beta hydrolase protein [Blastocladiella britannica]
MVTKANHRQGTGASSGRPPRGLIARAAIGTIRLALVIIALLVALVAALVLVPSLQRGLVYMHWVNFPFGDLDPVAFGFRDDTSRSFSVTTADNVKLHGWHLVSAPAASTGLRAKAPLARGSGANTTDEATFTVGPHDTVLVYYHGNAGNIAVRHRRHFYRAAMAAADRAARMASTSSATTGVGRVHLLTADYRGFGRSGKAPSGSPDELGLRADARAVWSYVVSPTVGARADQVVVIGHSLGTGVAANLLSARSDDPKSPQNARGLILLAPYTSIPDAALEYPYVPLGKLLGGRTSPAALWLRSHVTEKWETQAQAVPHIRCPLLLVHGARDGVVHAHHSRALWAQIVGPVDEEDEKRTVVGRTEGVVLDARHVAHGQGVTLAEITHGGHDDLHEFAVVRDVMAHWLAQQL